MNRVSISCKTSWYVPNIYKRFPVFSYAFPCFPYVFPCFPVFFFNVFPWFSLFSCVFLFSPDSPCFLVFLYVLPWFSLFARVFLCFPLILLVFQRPVLYVFLCFPVFFYVFPILPVFPCFSTFSPVFPCFSLSFLFPSVFLRFPLFLAQSECLGK